MYEKGGNLTQTYTSDSAEFAWRQKVGKDWRHKRHTRELDKWLDGEDTCLEDRVRQTYYVAGRELPVVNGQPQDIQVVKGFREGYYQFGANYTDRTWFNYTEPPKLPPTTIEEIDNANDEKMNKSSKESKRLTRQEKIDQTLWNWNAPTTLEAVDDRAEKMDKSSKEWKEYVARQMKIEKELGWNVDVSDGDAEEEHTSDKEYEVKAGGSKNGNLSWSKNGNLSFARDIDVSPRANVTRDVLYSSDFSTISETESAQEKEYNEFDFSVWVNGLDMHERQMMLEFLNGDVPTIDELMEINLEMLEEELGDTGIAARLMKAINNITERFKQLKLKKANKADFRKKAKARRRAQKEKDELYEPVAQLVYAI